MSATTRTATRSSSAKKKNTAAAVLVAVLAAAAAAASCCCSPASAFVVPNQQRITATGWGLARTTTTPPLKVSSSSDVDRSRSTDPSSRGNNGNGNRRDSGGNRNFGGGGGNRNFGGGGGGNRQQFQRGGGGQGGSSAPGNRNFRPGGGGGAGVLKLDKPLKLHRVVDQVAAESEDVLIGGSFRRDNSSNQQQRDGGGGGRGGGGGGGYDSNRGPVASKTSQPGRGGPSAPGGGGGPATSESSYGGDDDDNNSRNREGDGPGGDSSKRRFGKKLKQKRGGRDDDGPPQRRTTLRLGTGKKGRAAEISRRRGSLKKRDRTAEKEAKLEAAAERRTVQLPDGPLSVSDLAEIIDEKPVSIIKFLMTDLGVMASMTQSLDPATCIAVTEGFGKIVGGAEEEDEELMEVLAEDSALASGVVVLEDDPEDLEPRPPVVTIMGHVDHGKTSLLDAIRNTDVTAGEAGGITQHIAAYQVHHKDKLITFIDTPGHAAFTDMRERGANITDIVILVVAADDGVKQQTADSIACARQAGVPVVVAINKCDLETADPMKVMTDLTGYDILTEEFGGDILSSQISAKEGTNLDDLLDKVMLQAEIQDLKANPDRHAEGIVIEANVEKGLGTVATTLVKKGTLRVGDVFVAGQTYGRVRALISTSDGKTRLDEAGPSDPVGVVGFEGIPAAGDILVSADDEQTARELAESRQRIAREQQSSTYQAGLMDSVAMTFGSTKEHREMCVVVKADVQGSAEALTRALRELKRENDEALVTVKVLVSEAGEVSKSDIAIASVTPDTTVLAFNVPASFAAMEDARAAGVPIEYYNIVYDAIESVESRMQEVLSPTPEGEFVGASLVQEVFNIGGTGNIAGSRCTEGFMKKGGNVRVMRGDKILCESKIKSLRNFKAETDTIEAGNECGIGLADFEDFEAGDIVECYLE